MNQPFTSWSGNLVGYSVNYGLIFEDSGFWVTHRGINYGLFSYQFSHDLEGIELYYQQEKFGEFCSEDEFCADLKPFHIPLTVSKVATIVLGVIIKGIIEGQSSYVRNEMVKVSLNENQLEKYAENISYERH